jgi:type VI secretion system secreted protein VgrG
MARLLKGETPLKDGQGQQAMVLLRMSGHEELGRLPEFQLEFRSKRGDIKPKEILGINRSWAIELAAGEVRYFNGFVTRFAEAGEAPTSAFEDGSKGKSYLYRATVHPWLWFLTRASNCRIFQNMTVPDIVKQVFGDYSFANFEPKLTGSYPQKEFSVQYRETDFNFVCRLLEQEGIHTVWAYDNGRNTLLLVDSDGLPGEAADEAAMEQERRRHRERPHDSFTGRGRSSRASTPTTTRLPESAKQDVRRCAGHPRTTWRASRSTIIPGIRQALAEYARRGSYCR